MKDVPGLSLCGGPGKTDFNHSTFRNYTDLCLYWMAVSEHTLATRITDMRTQFGLRDRNHGNGGGACCQTPPRLIFGGNKDWPESDAGQRERKTHQSDTLIGSLALDDLKNHSDIYFLKST